MKKFIYSLLLLCGISSLGFADSDINGIITSIDPAAKTITINQNMKIKVLPNTAIEIDGRFFDSYGNFANLRLNDFVEVEIAGYNAYAPAANQEFIATSIDIQREGRAAY